MKRSLLVAFAAVALLRCGGTPADRAQPAAATPAQGAPAVAASRAIFANGSSVELEVAADDETRQQGLMFRDRVRPGSGMLFIFPSTDVYAFWMKNTFIPLDMIWITGEGKIVDIKSDVPPCKADPCPSYPPSGPARLVLELGAGGARQYGLKIGDVVRFEKVPLDQAR